MPIRPALQTATTRSGPLSPGVYATNAQLVANPRTLLNQMGFSLMSSAQARKQLCLN